VRPSAKQRITESVETALGLAGGVVTIDFVDLPSDDPERERRFSEKMGCPNEHDVDIDELEPRQFSFNGPWGACPECSGLGTLLDPDPELIIPNDDLTLADGAIAPWTTPTIKQHYEHVLESLAAEHGFAMDTPWRKLPVGARSVLLHGAKGNVVVSYRNRFGRVRSYSQKYEGVIPFIRRRYDEAETDSARDRWGGYMREVNCPACGGARLKPSSLSVTVAGRTIAELADLSIGEAAHFLGNLKLTVREAAIAERLVKEINTRLKFLLDVGLDYLTLSRAAGSLSGGEAQRIRLATQIGSGLTGVLYVLDEPSIGLHQRDNERLLGTLTRLRDLGNTVIVVEHDEDAIRLADYVLDIGPGAGVHGGEIVGQGTLQDILDAPRSLTGQYLSGKRAIEIPARRHKPNPKMTLRLRGASGNNLKGVDLDIPSGLLTCITGVSGSGKSTLINDTLFSLAANEINGASHAIAPYKSVDGLDLFDKVVDIDQSPIGRTPRSNPATYTGLFTPLRELYAQVPEARARGYSPGRFSFNVRGGRCEACQGDGLIKVEMHFLPDVYVPCDVCHGKRYNRETLEILYKGYNINDVLEMTVEDALKLFEPVPSIARKLETLVDVGLSYIKLGQSATTLSGGEAQRVKLSKELSRRDTGRTLYILDEPTTGLHFHDSEALLGVLHKLRDEGNTVVVIEHNLDVIKTADWIVDLGPEGGHRGGTILVTGTPEDVAAHPDSYTGQFLAKMLPSTSARPERPAAVANKPDARPPRKVKPEKPAKKAAAAKTTGKASKSSPATTTKKKKA